MSSMKKGTVSICFRASFLVMYPPLYEGDRVVRGPDWQWGNQGDCGEGTIRTVKDWKGQTGKGVAKCILHLMIGIRVVGQRRPEHVSVWCRQ